MRDKCQGMSLLMPLSHSKKSKSLRRRPSRSVAKWKNRSSSAAERQKEAAMQRVSYGSGPHRAAMGLLRRIASEAQTTGTFKALTEGVVPYEEVNGLMGK